MENFNNAAEESKKKKKPKRIKPRVWLVSLWVCISLLAFMVIIAGSAAFYIWNQLQPPKAGATIELKVTPGMSANGISDLLEEKGLIKSSFIFGYYLVVSDQGSGFQAGTYEMQIGMDKTDIISMLNNGDVVDAETVKFTIPEGYTIVQIAELLSKEGYADKDKFLSLINENRTWKEVETVFALPEDTSKILQRLEGYLFPETYEMVKGSSEEEIILRLLKEMDRKLGSLPEDWQDALEASGYSLHEILTIASLIEREVVLDEERATVAGVIYNRLKKPMRLQIDATIQYALGSQKELLTIEDTELESVYNTYQIDGLPPGPISSPSLDSIKAALYPQEHDYLYYVTKKDGTFAHLFAKTYDEHLRNIEKSKAK